MKINVIKYKKVKSTNDTALKLIKKNITNPTLVTTEKQTNGRGTVGKKWVSEKGNLFISLFFKQLILLNDDDEGILERIIILTKLLSSFKISLASLIKGIINA